MKNVINFNDMEALHIYEEYKSKLSLDDIVDIIEESKELYYTPSWMITEYIRILDSSFDEETRKEMKSDMLDFLFK